MARRKPDVAEHMGALRPSLQRALVPVVTMIRRGYRPQTLHLHSRDVSMIVDDLRGSGFDVARGVVLCGLPVRAYEG